MKPQRIFFEKELSKKSEFTQHIILNLPVTKQAGFQNLFRKIDLWIHPEYSGGMTQKWDCLYTYCKNFEFHLEILRRPFENKIFLCVLCD